MKLRLRFIYLLMYIGSIMCIIFFAINCEVHYSKISAEDIIQKEEEERKLLLLAEKKISPLILKKIDLMTTENARANPKVKEVYYTKSIPIDDLGRLLIDVKAKSLVKTKFIEIEIKALCGKIIAEDLAGSCWVYKCWMPYEKIRELAKLYEVKNISTIPYFITR